MVMFSRLFFRRTSLLYTLDDFVSNLTKDIRLLVCYAFPLQLKAALTE